MATSDTASDTSSSISNVLYAIGVPKAVTADRLGVILNPCGIVKSFAIHDLPGNLRRTWRLEFENATKGAPIS
jgi:hypothetical protein